MLLINIRKAGFIRLGRQRQPIDTTRSFYKQMKHIETKFRFRNKLTDIQSLDADEGRRFMESLEPE